MCLKIFCGQTQPNCVSFVLNGKEAQTLNSEEEVEDNFWSSIYEKYVSSILPQFQISLQKLQLNSEVCVLQKVVLSEAEWQSVSAGCDDGTHFALWAEVFL